MSELELRLAELREELVFPPTPTFELRLDRRPARSWRPLVVVLAAVAILVAGALALSPGARSAFLELFHLRGATVSLVDELPEVESIRTLDLLGERVTRDEAERRIGFRLLDLGEPASVRFRKGGIATLVYGDPDEPRLLLTQARGGLFDGFIRKSAGSGTEIDRVSVDGDPGLFVSGADHFVMFRNAEGRSTTSSASSPARPSSGTGASSSSGSRRR
ncbi:MAG TPA: hypothetical protein VNI55_09540 [Gaiellaceae bacterium]|nr:hypothetical protein [Gaiellaceae bacterium]